MKKLLKELYQFGFMYDFQKDLLKESKNELDKLIDSDNDLKQLPKIYDEYFTVGDSKK